MLFRDQTQVGSPSLTNQFFNLSRISAGQILLILSMLPISLVISFVNPVCPLPRFLALRGVRAVFDSHRLQLGNGQVWVGHPPEYSDSAVINFPFSVFTSPTYRTCSGLLPYLKTVTPLHFSFQAKSYMLRTSSTVALLGRLTVFETALSVCF